VFMSGPVLLWEHVGAGLVEPLDEYLAEAPGEFDLADFLPRLLEVNRWTGHAGDPLGTGPLLEIPVNCESYNLAFVPDILTGCGLDVPQTWEDYFAVARDIARGTDGEIRGFGQRGRGEWHTMYTGFATQLWSCGGRDFDPDGRAAFADAEAVAVTASFIEALRDAGPVDWTEQRWYELALDFARGRYALLVDSDHYVAFFEDERHSELVGRISYALPPAGPAGERRPNLWTWSLAMTAASRDKRAARDFIAWAASKPFLLRRRRQHEPDAQEHVGRPGLPGTHRSMGRVRRRVAKAAQQARDRPRHPHAALPRDRPALDRGAARGVPGPRRRRGAPRRRGGRRAEVRRIRLTGTAEASDSRFETRSGGGG